MTLFELRYRARKFRDILEGIVKNAIYDTQDVIVELQKEQLLHGKDSSGEDIAPSYRNDS